MFSRNFTESRYCGIHVPYRVSHNSNDSQDIKRVWTEDAQGSMMISEENDDNGEENLFIWKERVHGTHMMKRN